MTRHVRPLCWTLWMTPYAPLSSLYWSSMPHTTINLFSMLFQDNYGTKVGILYLPFPFHHSGQMNEIIAPVLRSCLYAVKMMRTLCRDVSGTGSSSSVLSCWYDCMKAGRKTSLVGPSKCPDIPTQARLVLTSPWTAYPHIQWELNCPIKGSQPHNVVLDFNTSPALITFKLWQRSQSLLLVPHPSSTMPNYVSGSFIHPMSLISKDSCLLVLVLYKL